MSFMFETCATCGIFLLASDYVPYSTAELLVVSAQHLVHVYGDLTTIWCVYIYPAICLIVFS